MIVPGVSAGITWAGRRRIRRACRCTPRRGWPLLLVGLLRFAEIAEVLKRARSGEPCRLFRAGEQERLNAHAAGDAGGGERLVDDGIAAGGRSRGREEYRGAQKNRMVNTTLLLPAGKYRVHYVSDGSHSFWNWNADPPYEAEMWGITVKYDRVSTTS